jgi:ABC-type arginine transport system permease subunit
VLPRGGGIVELTTERWVVEVYRTIIGTLQGLAWVLLIFFAFTLLAFVIVRVFETRRPKA